MDLAKQIVETFLRKAGITINGGEPHDIQVFNEKVYARIIMHGSLGLGEAYMDGWWEAKALDQFFHKILSANLDNEAVFAWSSLLQTLQASVRNLQSVSRAFQVGERHYDIGNDLYEAMLDGSMTYSCGYWKGAKTLDQAQEKKLDLICRKIGLKEGDSILDIGCGWGGFLRFAAEKYGAQGTGLTVSKEQAKLARERCKGLDVTVFVEDYRTFEGRFDHLVSVGMFEHVGPKNYRTYFTRASRLLKDGGLFLLHTIGSSSSSASGDPWMDRYIFPNGTLPSPKHIAEAIEGLFVMEDWHNFGAYYDKTLMAWFKNFNEAWPRFEQEYGKRFYRMWKYYLLACAGAFRARKMQLWQLVLSKNGVPGGYQSVR